MFSPDIQILIPCHSFEDFPTEQTDDQAASLLNSFAIAFHPTLLAWTGEFPRWRRADDTPLPRRNQLIIIPTVSDGWLPHSWADDARSAGATVVSGLSDRHEMLNCALKAVLTESELTNDDATTETLHDEAAQPINLPEPLFELPDIDVDLVADFLSLGTCWLLVELLTRKMRQFGNIDETRFFQRAQAGAKAALADDRETAETHLRACFEMLLEARERFYPVECYLLDLCLAAPEIDHEKLLPECQQSVPFSLLVSADDLTQICEKTPGLSAALSEAWQANRIGVIGGEDREAPLSLLSLESALYRFEHGRALWRRLLGKEPVVWGRRRFGLNALLPQLLVKFGYKAALHVALDDGIYPDAEYTKLRWRGVDGSTIDAISRIPLATESASSYLRIPVRMAESMDHDQVAGLIFARWPEVKTPFFEDLRRSQKYAPCLGRFVTIDRFFELTELPGQLCSNKASEYFSPFLIQHIARSESEPISRYRTHAQLRRRFEIARWIQMTAAALLSKSFAIADFDSLEAKLETVSLERRPDDAADFAAFAELETLEMSATAELTRIIMGSAKSGQGMLILNPRSFTRRMVVPLPSFTSPPAVAGAVKSVDFDAKHPDQMVSVVEVPGCGYAWIAPDDSVTSIVQPKQPLAEAWLLRNDQFEVAINQRTGGIAHVRYHNQRTKRFSQQLSFRFPRERIMSSGDETLPTKSQYAEMRCMGSKIVHSGTARGEVATFGEVIDQTNQEKLAAFRQTVRVWRAIPTIELEIELSDVKLPDGDPWNNYFASRFAWNDSGSAVTRSIFHSAHSFIGERFETTDYIEIASSDERVTIVPHGLPFHRQTGDRMVDSLLVVAGESSRKFRFTIAIDSPYPMEVAWNATVPLTAVPTETGPPRTGNTGWFFHIDAKHVQLSRILEATSAETSVSPLEQFEHSTIPDKPGFAVRLIETEGRTKPIKLRCYGRPTYARKRDFRGNTTAELLIDGDAVVVDMAAYEIADVELRF